MSGLGGRWRVKGVEDSELTIIARLSNKDGSGSATGVDGEGNWLQQADISGIDLSVFDLDSSTPTTAVYTESLTIASVILDTPVTTNVNWSEDTTGYNFLYDLPDTVLTNGGHLYVAEFKVTLSAGPVGHFVVEIDAEPLIRS